MADLSIFSLEGKIALVTGIAGPHSLAAGIVLAFQKAGAETLITYQEGNDRMTKRVLAFAKTNGNIPAIPMDVTKPEQMDAVFNYLERLGGMDILVHAIAFARIRTFEGSFWEIFSEDFAEAIDISARSLHVLTQRAVPLMNKRGGGNIIALTYRGGEIVIPGYNMMGVAKSTLDATAMYLAYFLGARNIRVNLISSGPVETPAAKSIPSFMTMKVQAREGSPLGLHNDKTDVGNAAVFFASDAARCITGQVLYVDNGFHIVGMIPRKITQEEAIELEKTEAKESDTHEAAS